MTAQTFLTTWLFDPPVLVSLLMKIGSPHRREHQDIDGKCSDRHLCTYAK